MNQVLLVGRFLEKDGRGMYMAVRSQDEKDTPIRVRVLLSNTLLDKLDQYNVSYNDMISIKGRLDNDGFGYNCVQAERIAFLSASQNYEKGGEIYNG